MSSPSQHLRQQVLYLWLSTSALDTPVIAWSLYDGASTDPVPPIASRPSPPYPTGLAAMRDGWRLIQSSTLDPPASGDEHRVSFLKYEFVFEKVIDISQVTEA